MKPTRSLLALLVLSLFVGSAARAEDAGKAAAASRSVKPADPMADFLSVSRLAERESLTNNWLGWADKIADMGLAASVSTTHVYQHNLNSSGGTSVHRRAGRYAGSYDIEGLWDLRRMFNVPLAGKIFIAAEGSWSDGLDASSIGSVGGMEVNADAAGDQWIQVSQFFYEQALLDGKLQFRLGKLDLTGTFECRGCPASFDGNSYANDPTAQFLNAALNNNPTIPFPEPGLGLVVYAEPSKHAYLAAGIADADADAREMGTNTTFHGTDNFFSIFEFGITPQFASANGPLQGAYRAGFWYDPQPKERWNGSTKRDDMGFYLSFDQALCKENKDPEDTQGLGAFFRYGYAHSDVSEIKWFWSVGCQYQGLIPSRDDDVLGFGVAQSILSRRFGFTRSHSTVMELYYNVQLFPWLTFSPNLQYIFNTGGDRSVGDAFVAGFRFQIAM